VLGNYIEVNASAAALGNGRYGINFEAKAYEFIPGGNNTIGGSVSAAGNTIADNSVGGVVVGSGDCISHNAIFANGPTKTGPSI
jgi:hypothetical protein